jgi:hypothetical protein
VAILFPNLPRRTGKQNQSDFRNTSEKRYTLRQHTRDFPFCSNKKQPLETQHSPTSQEGSLLRSTVLQSATPRYGQKSAFIFILPSGREPDADGHKWHDGHTDEFVDKVYLHF